MNCPLCHNDYPALFSTSYSSHTKSEETYYQCPSCYLIYIDSNHWLSPQEEKLRYNEHNNDPTDPRYRQYLTRAIHPLLPYLSQGDLGLDFGCGPGPTLSIIFKELGYEVSNFDPYYANDMRLFEREYQFIISTEVFEHLNKPYKELQTIKDILAPNGYLCLMTQLYSNEISFDKWWYKNDPTHIVFYQKETMAWISEKYNLQLEYLEDNIIIFKNT